MNNFNPVQLMGLLKSNDPHSVVKQVISQNFASDPLMQNLLRMAENGEQQNIQQFAINFFNSQGTTLEKEMQKLQNVLRKN